MTSLAQTLPLSRYLAVRRRQLREDYPELSREDLHDQMRLVRGQWFDAVRKYERGDMVEPCVYRSYRYHLGPQEAIRTFRYAGNLTQLANLPSYIGDGEEAR